MDGRFLGPGGTSVPTSQALVTGILEECFEIAQEIRAREDDVSHKLKPIYDRLMELRAQLESLVMTHRWTLRETDLWNYENALRDIDKMRVDGKFVDAEGNKPEGQYVEFSYQCYILPQPSSSTSPLTFALDHRHHRFSCICYDVATVSSIAYYLQANQFPKNSCLLCVEPLMRHRVCADSILYRLTSSLLSRNV